MISAERFLATHPVTLPVPDAPDAPDVPDDSRASGTSAVADASGAPVAHAGVHFGGTFGRQADAADGAGARGHRSHGAWRASARGGRRTARRADAADVADVAGGGIGRSGASALHDRDARDEDACREAALTLLDAAPRSSDALAHRLADKGYEVCTVGRVVERLTQVGLLDDEAYARSVLRACTARDMGARGTAQEMRRRSVPAPIAARVVAEARESGVFDECAWELGRRVAARTAGLERDARYRRLWSAGGRKGHDPETLRAVAQELLG